MCSSFHTTSTSHTRVKLNCEQQRLLICMDEICWWFPRMSSTLQQTCIDSILFHYDILRRATYVYHIHTWLIGALATTTAVSTPAVPLSSSKPSPNHSRKTNIGVVVPKSYHRQLIRLHYRYQQYCMRYWTKADIEKEAIVERCKGKYTVRWPRTRRRRLFHADICNILALLCATGDIRWLNALEYIRDSYIGKEWIFIRHAARQCLKWYTRRQIIDPRDKGTTPVPREVHKQIQTLTL